MRILPYAAIGLATSALLLSGASAADWPGSYAGNAGAAYQQHFDFEGFYLGGTAGGASLSGTGVVGSVGVVVGANFAVTDAILAGLEFQGDTLWNGAGFVGLDGLLLGKVGGYLSNEIVIYGTGGGGIVNGAGAYGIGAGLEMMFAQQLSGRVEALGTGTWGAWPDGGKATVGLIWHMN